MEKWKNGKVENGKWKMENGKVEKWKNGKVEKWKNGKVEKWKNGKMEKWEKWKSGLDNMSRKKLTRFCYHIRHSIHSNVSIRILQTHITVNWVHHESMYCDIYSLSVYNTLSNATKDET